MDCALCYACFDDMTGLSLIGEKGGGGGGPGASYLGAGLGVLLQVVLSLSIQEIVVQVVIVVQKTLHLIGYYQDPI